MEEIKERKLPDLFCNRWVTIGVCAYETVAIVSKSEKIPPITVLHARNKWVGVAFTAALGWHFIKTSMEA